MRQEIIEKLSKMGCKVQSLNHSIYYNNGQKDRVIEILEANGYEIRASNDFNCWYRPTSKIFMAILVKYNIDNIFEAMECFTELMNTHECALGACGSEFHIWNSDLDFSFKIDFKNHKAEAELKL